MSKQLTREYDIIKKIITMYEDRLTRAANGEDSMRNDIELEILYVIYSTLNKSIRENNIPEEIKDAWLAVQMHFTMLSIREEKTNHGDYCDMFDSISNQLFLNIISND